MVAAYAKVNGAALRVSALPNIRRPVLPRRIHAVHLEDFLCKVDFSRYDCLDFPFQNKKGVDEKICLFIVALRCRKSQLLWDAAWPCSFGKCSENLQEDL